MFGILSCVTLGLDYARWAGNKVKIDEILKIGRAKTSLENIKTEMPMRCASHKRREKGGKGRTPSKKHVFSV